MARDNSSGLARALALGTLLLVTAWLALTSAGCRRAAEESSAASSLHLEGNNAVASDFSVAVGDSNELTADERTSLESLRKVDDHPLYVMHQVGDYELPVDSGDLPVAALCQAGASWACSLFVTWNEESGGIFGRNFDWIDSPALLLFTDPPGRNASVSMVDISYLGYGHDELGKLDEVDTRDGLLEAVQIPFDGMNEHGLTIGMAAVPDADAPHDEALPTVGSLLLIRLALDYCENVDEAIELFSRYNIDFYGGPQIHYLIADPSGESALVELTGGKAVVHRNDHRWQVATNFYLDGAGPEPQRNCWRFARLTAGLDESAHGVITVEDALEMLSGVAQSNTRWSMVYSMNDQAARVVMSRRFDSPLEFKLEPTQSAIAN